MNKIGAIGIVIAVLVIAAAAYYAVGNRILGPGGGSTSVPSGANLTVANYAYCVGTQATPQQNQSYFAPIYSNGELGQWKATTPYPIQHSFAGCSIYNGAIYCVGTYSNNGNQFSDTYYAKVNSTGIGQWQQGTSYPIPLYNAGCSSYRGYLYCVGSEYGSMNEVYYTKITGTGMQNWTAGTSYPEMGHSASCLIYNSTLYCIGTGNYPFYNSYYVGINESSGSLGSWVKTTSYPVAKLNAGCNEANGYIYCVGTSATSAQNESYYAPITPTGIGNWTPTTPYPIQLGFAGCFVSNDYIYCAGSSNTGMANLVYYAPISTSGIGQWQRTTNYPVALDDAYCVVPGYGGGYYSGGGPSQ